MIMALKPDVIIVTGDHSTPAVAKSHTSHPVPFLIGGEGVRADGTAKFGERACARKLKKFGA
jgi:2,3-bisphosphoglycerate-independent phosphoglycerate mutase